MYQPWHVEGDPQPDLTIFDAMGLDGDEYEALKKELAQPIEQAIGGVSHTHTHTHNDVTLSFTCSSHIAASTDTSRHASSVVILNCIHAVFTA